MEGVIHHIDAVLVLSTQDGSRVWTKYFSNPNHSVISLQDQYNLEKQLFFKMHKLAGNATNEPEIITTEGGATVLFQIIGDLAVFVYTRDLNCNELVIYEVIQCLIESLNAVFQNQVEKRTVMENLDYLLLIVEEMIEDGIIMELDSKKIADRIENLDSLVQGFQIAGEKVNLGAEGDTVVKLLKGAKNQLSELTSSLFQF